MILLSGTIDELELGMWNASTNAKFPIPNSEFLQLTRSLSAGGAAAGKADGRGRDRSGAADLRRDDARRADRRDRRPAEFNATLLAAFAGAVDPIVVRRGRPSGRPDRLERRLATRWPDHNDTKARTTHEEETFCTRYNGRA
jgi:hypothetical protein